MPPEAEAFKRYLPQTEIHLIEAGYFAIGKYTQRTARLILGLPKKTES